MFNKHHLRILFIFIMLVITTMGCAPQGSKTENEEPMTGLANPASVYCQGLGYQEETRENELGQYGVCLFPDGTECDTWDFLAGRCGKEYSYCAQQGFEMREVENSNIGTCVFKDGSTCLEYAYFEGDCKPGENMP
jgi:putative hemolysin